MYAAQAWELSQAEKNRLDIVYKGFLRKMLGRKGRAQKTIIKKDKNGNDVEFTPKISDEKLYKITKNVTSVRHLQLPQNPTNLPLNDLSAKRTNYHVCTTIMTILTFDSRRDG